MTTSNPTAESTDRIEKKFHVNAPVSRVWRAVSNHEEFGSWFRMTIDRPFATGESVLGRITIPGYEHVTVEMRIERIEPENYFSYRWHPYAVDPAIDYSAEPMTLVEFRLEAAQGGTSVTIVESGFDRLPSDRRAEAFRMNQGGWDGQARNLAAHVG
ncbi:SRPBCC family protein [Gemmatimonadota bacterium Y43]|uniref:SRPBCC family protein n=1 Tax=Gaopeijia maritima TaxID=3119007 RepID=UPI00328C40C2